MAIPSLIPLSRESFSWSLFYCYPIPYPKSSYTILSSSSRYDKFHHRAFSYPSPIIILFAIHMFLYYCFVYPSSRIHKFFIPLHSYPLSTNFFTDPSRILHPITPLSPIHIFLHYPLLNPIPFSTCNLIHICSWIIVSLYPIPYSVCHRIHKCSFTILFTIQSLFLHVTVSTNVPFLSFLSIQSLFLYVTLSTSVSFLSFPFIQVPFPFIHLSIRYITNPLPILHPVTLLSPIHKFLYYKHRSVQVLCLYIS